MDITSAFIQAIEKEGVVLDNKEDVYKSIDDCVSNGRVDFIVDNGNNIGFFTWEETNDGGIFINNLLIFKKFRCKIYLRRFFLNYFNGNGAFSWINRKSKRSIHFINRRVPCYQ